MGQYTSTNTEWDDEMGSWLENNGIRYVSTDISDYETNTFNGNTEIKIPVKQNYFVAGYSVTFKVLALPIRYTADVYSQSNELLETHSFEYTNSNATVSAPLVVGRSLPNLFVGSEIKIVINRGDITNISYVKLYGQDLIPTSLKSDPNISGGEINLLNFYPNKPYQFSILRNNQSAALNVYDINIDIQNKTVTFNNLIKYDSKFNKVYEFRNSNWTDITSTYFTDNNIPRIYNINVFNSVIDSIKNSVSINPSDFLMYDNPFTKQTPVITVTRQNGYYRFISALGGTDFDEKTGEPIRSFDTTGNFLPYIKFVVYKYDGYSQITSNFLTTVNSALNTNTPQIDPNVKYGQDWQDFWGDRDFISNYNLYVYNIDNNQIGKVNKIARKKNQPAWTWDIYFYAYQNTWDRGVAFKFDGTPIESQSQIPGKANEVIRNLTVNPKPSDAYRIYFERIGQFISPDNTTLVSMSFINFIINQYQRVNILFDNFQITIPSNKPTNRIFVYESSTNKLVHVTDYIPKGTTQNVTINYSKGINGITSSVIPVDPLPVPNFYRYVSNVKAPYYNGDGDDDQGWNGGAICRNGQILESRGNQIGNNDSYMGGSCMSIYDNKIPVSSINNDGYQNITYYTDYNPNRFYNCEDGNNRGKIADIQFFGYRDCHGACLAGSKRWTTYRNTGIKIEQCAYPSI